MQVIFSLQHGLPNEFMRRVQPIMSKGPVKLPDWIPEPIRRDALAGKFKNGPTRVAGPPPFGPIVVWCDNSSGYLNLQIYQEFPDSLAFYTQLIGDSEHRGRLLHGVYTQFNRDMWSFLSKGLPPEMARDEIRRINNEVFKLVLEGCIAILTTGAGISAINSTMRRNAEEVERAADRIISNRASSREGQSAIDLVRKLQKSNKKVVVNLGGTGEVEEAINLNPNVVASRKDIPNWVKGTGEAIGDMFEPNSLDSIVSNHLPPNTIDWRRVIPGAHKSLKPGGSITIAFRGVGNDSEIILAELKRLKFDKIDNLSGAVIKAVKSLKGS